MKKLAASISWAGVYDSSVWMMRFCTSPSGLTMISRMRLSDSRMNSICRNACARRGVITTPAKCDRLDSVRAAAVIMRCGPSCWPPSWSWIWPVSSARSALRSSGLAVSIESTNSR
ncbi:hypothetical protein D3C72_1852380 [compost metagenome]